MWFFARVGTNVAGLMLETVVPSSIRPSVRSFFRIAWPRQQSHSRRRGAEDQCSPFEGSKYRGSLSDLTDAASTGTPIREENRQSNEAREPENGGHGIDGEDSELMVCDGGSES